MPARPSRNTNARNTRKSNAHLPSPPTQPPTPLPEQERPMHLDVGDDRLIDFDTPTPPPQQYIHLPLQDEEDVLAQTYRSPPFREASLPDLEQDSPPPLPIPPRGEQEEVYDDHVGHTRWPTYPSSNNSSRNSSIPPPTRPTRSASPASQTPSTFHSLTRTLRSYVPSSIHIPIPSAAPSPPLVSRPLSFGRFSSDLRMDGLALGLTTAGDPVRGRKVVSTQEFERDYERDGPEGQEYYQYGGHGYSYGHGYGYGQQPQPPLEAPASGLARAFIQNRTAAQVVNSNASANTSMDNSSGMDIIEWARWDVLGDRRFLLLAYPAGLQIWDCSDLTAISEILNLNFNSAEWSMVLGNGKGGSTRRQEEGKMAQVIHAALLSSSSSSSGMKDPFAGDRPLLGILMQMDHIEDDYHDEDGDSSFVLYSLRKHQIVKRIPLSGSPSTFTANDQLIIISMASPCALLVLSPTTFQTLHIIPSSSLELFSPLPPTTTSNPSSPPSSIISNKPVPLTRLSIDDRTSHHHHHRRQRRRRQYHIDGPYPVFTLSHRLLAYTSPSPFSLSPLPSSSSIKSNPSSTVSIHPSSTSPSPSPFVIGKVTQADLGQAALKVGETVLGGMKLLGGMAYGAARSRVSGDFGRVVVGRGGEPGGRRFVSRSAPDTAPVDNESDSEQKLRERRFSNTSGYHVAPPTNSSSSATSNTGYYITLLDLSPLAAGKKGALPVKIDEFMSSRSQPIADLRFSADGTSLAVIQRDGYVVKTFKIRPIASILLSSSSTTTSGLNNNNNNETEMRKQQQQQRWRQQPLSNSVQVYNLRRGRTSAVVEGSDWSKDGRWLAIGTRKRTVHVFAVNPYGGKPDIASHLEGRVRNVDFFQHPLTELSPLIRLRSFRPSSAADHLPPPPLAFTFISPLDISHSPRLLPHTSNSRTPSSPTLLTTPSKQQQQQFQDVLLFDPADGVLSLRRLSLDKQFVREQGLGIAAAAAASVQALGGGGGAGGGSMTSRSLPGMGGAGKLASSVSPSSRSGGSSSAVVSVMDHHHHPVVELVAKESTVATWNLQRRMDWGEIKQVIVDPENNKGWRMEELGGDWLAEAELTTCSSSQHVLPRSIYLSHQFTFHTLGEDYHALIRRHQFDICGAEIKVRKQVEISAYSPSNNNSNNDNDDDNLNHHNASAAAFIEGFSAPRDIRRASSSFDEPIASAISGSFDNSNLPSILPMYPNGLSGSGSKPKSFRNSSIPIRTMAAGIGDGVSEGLGRIRREMNRVRSPQLLPRSEDSSMSVPLEFDEEDEDFLVRDNDDGRLQVPSTMTTHHHHHHHHRDDISTSRGTSREGRTSAESTSSLSLDTPADTSIHHHHQQHHHLPLMDDGDVVGTVDEEIWSANGWWDQQDALAIDEAEQFDNISVVGYLDEEQQQQQPRPPPVIPPVLNSRRKGRQRLK